MYVYVCVCVCVCRCPCVCVTQVDAYICVYVCPYILLIYSYENNFFDLTRLHNNNVLKWV